MPTEPCPPSTDLAAFHQGGDLPADTADWLAAHLAVCPDCETYLESLDAKERTEVIAFRRFVATAPADGGPAAIAEAGALVGGRYKLIEPLGEGGMGSVWLAQQTDPVSRAVAVKLIKPGMDSRDVLARFEAERQALALMDHPNIAKVLDAGQTAAGRPFFVMELVKGAPITRYCDDRKLTPRERLALFVPVCQAVQHAHQRGVIHRDLKPTNILVAEYDGEPAPKVIDFGIAKAVGRPLTDLTLLTGFGSVVGTPEYMSPEQAAFTNQDVDTRSDVYALGVLLYELLTGATPLARPAPGADLLELFRELRELDPLRPSARLSGSATLPATAAARGSEPARLVKSIRGELDWIVMRALEKDRNRRYQTAGDLAADVGRYLAGEPVTAVPPSPVYWARQFARRRRAPLLTAAVLLLGVVPAAYSVWRNAPRDAGPVAAPAPELAVAVPDVPFAEWARGVADLPAADQPKAVNDELKRRNPGYDGRAEFKITDGVVTKFHIVPARVKDISPVRALTGLKIFQCSGNAVPLDQRELTDLSPLAGFPLTELDCGFLPVTDLRPLHGMPLTVLMIAGSNVTDLSPLAGMKLTFLNASRILTVTDLSPLRGMPLKTLYCNRTKVTDLSPLVGTPLEQLGCDFSPARQPDVIRRIPTLRTVNGMSAALLWHKLRTADLTAATYILAAGGTVRLDDAETVYAKDDPLPPKAFRLTAVNAAHCKTITAEGLAAFEFCQHVKEINFQVTPLTDEGLAFFRNCPDLHGVYLDQTRVTDAGLTWFAGRTNVTHLRLDLTAVGDAGVAHFGKCANLVELALPLTRVTDAGLAHFKGCRRLKIIVLDQTAVSDAGVRFLEHCPDLEHAGLTRLNLSPAGMGVLKNHPRLTFVNVSAIRMRPEGLAALATCEKLDTLYMNGADVSQTSFEPLSRFPALKTLSLEGALGMTDALLMTLVRCKELREVRVKGTAVTPAGAAALKAVRPDCDVKLGGS